MTQRTAGAALFLLVCLPAVPASADNTSIFNAHPGVYGEVRTEALAATNTAGQSNFLGFGVTQNRSYAAICWLPLRDGEAGMPGALGPGCEVSWRDQFDSPVGANGGQEPFGSGSSLSSASVLPSGTDRLFVRIRNLSGGAVTARVLVLETTLFSPWYFVSAASGYEGYVVLRNNTTATVNATVRGYANDGTLTGTVTVALPPNGNTFVGLGAQLGAPSGSGSATIAHDGSFGAIVANLTTLSATTGLSFDAPFTTRMSWATFGQ